MHLRGNVIYKTWENFWKKAYKSSYFRAQYDETSERTDWSLSERQLFTVKWKNTFGPGYHGQTALFVHSS